MPTDLSIRAVDGIAGAREHPGEPYSVAISPTPPPTPVAPAPPAPNPVLRLDPALGLVVMEFRDGAGNVTTSVPTLRQIEAYRTWTKSPAPDTAGTAPIHGSATRKA